MRRDLDCTITTRCVRQLERKLRSELSEVFLPAEELWTSK